MIVDINIKRQIGDANELTKRLSSISGDAGSTLSAFKDYLYASHEALLKSKDWASYCDERKDRYLCDSFYLMNFIDELQTSVSHHPEFNGQQEEATA